VQALAARRAAGRPVVLATSQLQLEERELLEKA
jgi:hypothetical protein